MTQPGLDFTLSPSDPKLRRPTSAPPPLSEQEIEQLACLSDDDSGFGFQVAIAAAARLRFLEAERVACELVDIGVGVAPVLVPSVAVQAFNAVLQGAGFRAAPPGDTKGN
jgi:hypothetical protein